MRRNSRNISRTIAMICAGVLVAGSAAEGAELLKNRKFKKDLEPWHIAAHGGKAKDISNVEDNVLRLRVGVSVPPAYVRLMQPVKVKSGKTYTLSFEARADGANLPKSPIIVNVCQRDPEWESYGLREKVVLEADWKKFEYTFTATEIDKDNKPVLRLLLGNIGGDIFFRGFSLVDE